MRKTPVCRGMPVLQAVPSLGLSQPHDPVLMLYALTAGHQEQLTSKQSEDKRLA